jgi:hypothetical protein
LTDGNNFAVISVCYLNNTSCQFKVGLLINFLIFGIIKSPMKNYIQLVLGVLLFALNSVAQKSVDAFWSPVNEANIALSGKRQIVPQRYLTFSLKNSKLKNSMFAAPNERIGIGQSTCIITLPAPDGTFQRFKVVESPIMAEELAAAYPDMKTFSVKGIDDPYASGKLDWNEFGFHGMVLTPNGDYFIDPYCLNNMYDYITYYTNDFVKDPSQRIPEAGLPVEDTDKKQEDAGKKTGARPIPSPAICIGGQLRSYRLAVACTGEYAVAATGTNAPTVAQTLAKIQTSVNRVDGVYEKEVAVRMVLVSTETVVIYTSASSDPFTGNNNANTLINESQTVIGGNISSANYDIGHTFSTGGGGLAFLGIVCTSASKAKGITGSSNPVGDPYDIDYVAHEMGHQFNGNHTFNAITGNCAGNRAAGTSVEPGSGVTIMAYAGICSGNDVANNSIPYFHAVSYDEIVNFTNSGSGNFCASIITTTNNPPTVTGSGNYIIPKSTPFILTGNGFDPDGDPITFSWEEIDMGTSGSNWNSGTMPFFRSYAPVTSPSRLFPKNLSVVNNNYTGVIGEYLPQTAQVLNFRLTARDNRMGGGGVCYAINSVTVDNSGPLNVSYPNVTGITWSTTTQKNVTWDVNNTDLPPVSCDSVSLWISYDGGNNYTLLLGSTPNDGIQTITVPTVIATIPTCRIKVQSKGNVFYDISNNNFTISTDLTVGGIKQASLNNPAALSAWPNPCNGQLNFVAGNLNTKSPAIVSIIDLLGNTVMRFTYSNKSELKETLNLEELAKGVYFIRLNNDLKQSVHKIVKE